MFFESFSEKETFKIGHDLGKNAKAGQVFCLYGDLGTGKTVISKGMADGLGIREVVNSPTFTIVKEYMDGRLPFYHFDVYRIGDSAEMEEIGFSDMIYGDGVSMIEWAELIEDILPERYTRITIEKDLAKGLDYRSIRIEDIGI